MRSPLVISIVLGLLTTSLTVYGQDCADYTLFTPEVATLALEPRLISLAISGQDLLIATGNATVQRLELGIEQIPSLVESFTTTDEPVQVATSAATIFVRLANGEIDVFHHDDHGTTYATTLTPDSPACRIIATAEHVVLTRPDHAIESIVGAPDGVRFGAILTRQPTTPIIDLAGDILFCGKPLAVAGNDLGLHREPDLLTTSWQLDQTPISATGTSPFFGRPSRLHPQRRAAEIESFSPTVSISTPWGQASKSIACSILTSRRWSTVSTSARRSTPWPAAKTAWSTCGRSIPSFGP